MSNLFVGSKISHEGIPEVEPGEVHQNLGKDFLIVDVRRHDEWVGELGHIQGSSFATLEGNFKEFISGLPKDKAVVFVCRSGGRSGVATMIAIGEGITKSYNMRGGMILWNALNFPKKHQID